MKKLSNIEAVWLAAVIDAEGYVGVVRDKRRKTQMVLIPRIEIGNTNIEFLEKAYKLMKKCGAKPTKVHIHYPCIKGRKTCYITGVYTQQGVPL